MKSKIHIAQSLRAWHSITVTIAASTTTELRVSGMTCNNCARTVTEAIQGTPGVQSATISLARKSATVRWKAGQAENISAVLAAVARSGFEAEEMDPATARAAEARSGRWEWNLILSLAATLWLMVGEWAFGLMLQPWFEWTAFLLAGAVQVFGGAPFYRGAWNQLKVGSSNMDTLVALGSTTAFGYSAWALLFGAGGHLYFMEAAAIISLISFGHWLEARVSENAGRALKSLLTLAPATARKLAPAKTEKRPESEG
jgi:Cu+-exporting ATPase